MSQQRMSVREAAELLGISPDGVRMRIKRGSMESERDAAGRVWVWADTSQHEPNSGAVHSSAEVESLREQVAYLRSVIEQRDEELARAHQLLGESLSQLRQLSPPAGEHEPGTEPHEASDVSPQEPPRPEPGAERRPGLGERLRRWWRSGRAQ